jgi:hypothetical protein
MQHYMVKQLATAHIVTANIANFPTSSAHPNIIWTLRHSNLCSISLIMGMSSATNSSTRLPNSCSQACGDQRSLPDDIQPVSSISVPMTFGFNRSSTSLSQFLHFATGALVYTGTPQLPDVRELSGEEHSLYTLYH